MLEAGSWRATPCPGPHRGPRSAEAPRTGIMRLTGPLPQGQAFLSPGQKRSPGIVPVASDLLRGARGCPLAPDDGRCRAGLLPTAATQTPRPHVVIPQKLQCQSLSVQPETAMHSAHQTRSLSQALATAPATDPSAGPLPGASVVGHLPPCTRTLPACARGGPGNQKQEP